MTAQLSLKSHISGKNADVKVYNDRIEYSQMKARSFWLTCFTFGANFLFPRREAFREVIPMKKVSSVVVSREGVLYSVARIITTGNTIDVKLTHDDATQLSSFINAHIV